MSASQKICPQCKHVTALDAQICTQCNHRFRTKFVVEPEATMMSVQPAPVAQMPEIEQAFLKIGYVRGHDTTLTVDLSVRHSAVDNIVLMMDNTDGRRREHVLILDLRNFEELKRLIAKTDQAIMHIKNKGRLD